MLSAAGSAVSTGYFVEQDIVHGWQQAFSGMPKVALFAGVIAAGYSTVKHSNVYGALEAQAELGRSVRAARRARA